MINTLFYQMIYLSAAIVLALLPSLLAVAPLSAAALPLKVSQVELRSTVGAQGGQSHVFEVAQYYRAGDRIALSASGLRFETPINFLLGEKMSWAIKLLENEKQIVLETTPASSQSHFTLRVSLIIIGKEWEEKVIFLQDLKVTQDSTIKHLENNLLLTTSTSNKFSSKVGMEKASREVFILYRGFEGQRGGVVNLRGYFLENQHIHIHTHLHNVTYCSITLLIIDLAQLAQLHLQLVRTTALPASNSLILLGGEVTLKECYSAFASTGEEECWQMQAFQEMLEFRRIEKEKNESITKFNELEDNQPFSLYGRNRLLSSCSSSDAFCGCTGDSCTCLSSYLNAATCIKDSSCNCKISACNAGYYTTSTLTTSCTACPANLTHCTRCGLQFGTTNVTCSACSPGYVVLNKVCVACPVGCATCTTILVNYVTTVTCVTCVATLTLKSSGSIKVCGCGSNQFLNTAVNPVACVTCPSSCLTCTSFAVCTACTVGNYMSVSSCLACMPVCKTCSAAGTCLTCLSTATLVSNVCTCPALTFFDTVTKTCLSCTTLKPNCATCNYASGSFTPASPTPVVCVIANTGFRVDVGTGSAVACVSRCINCDFAPATACTTCKATFTFDGTSSCVCIPPLYFSTAQDSCLSCPTVIPGCGSCQNNGVPTATDCLSCDPGFFTAAYPTFTCTACPNVCLTCTSSTVCQTCLPGLAVFSNMCGCNSGASMFLTSALTCSLCGDAIFGCQTCVDSPGGVTCAGPSPGFYCSSTECFPCPATCSACSDATTCTGCRSGYSPSGGSCTCTGDCPTCLGLSGNSCSDCTVPPAAFSCTTCAVGFYDNAGTCTPCTPDFSHCASCTISGCLSCTSPFILSAAGCVCDNAAGLYLSVDLSTCSPCSTAIPNCQTCTNTGSATICSISQPGYFIDPLQQSCSPCSGPCLTCSTSDTHCLTCLVTYSMVTPNNCDCDNSANLFYDPATTGCSLCTSIIPNCQTCSTTGLVTTCTLCSGLFYWDVGLSSCEACSPECTACSSASVCTGCPNNLVLSQTVPGYVTAGVCVCNNNTLPLTYFDTSSGTCQECSYFYTTCTACYVNGSTVLCSSDSGSTYLVNGATVNCPSPCSTCNATGCLSCPAGMTLNGGSCDCDTSCTSCGTLSVGCVSCTITSGAISSCSACIPGTYLASPNCLSCPATCATCTSPTACLTCQPSYVLLGTMCSCPLALGIFPDSAAICKSCSTIFYACTECEIISGSTACVACSSGYFLLGGQCSACSSSCVTCAVSATACTSCATGQTLSSGTCSCSTPDCIACDGHSPNCASCVYTIYGIFTQCGTCSPDYFLAGGSCSPCPPTCQSCGAGGDCLTCPDTFQLIGTDCACNPAKNMWQSAGSCTSCASLYPDCATCAQNATEPLNVSCLACDPNYYLAGGNCAPSVCGDGQTTDGQACDDGNAVSGDGCSNYCQVELNFACSGTPSICTVSINYFITLKQIVTATSACNQFDISFDIDPVYAGYDSANFEDMLSFVSLGSVSYKSWSYSSGVVTYTFAYSANVNKKPMTFYFSPARLGIPETATVPVIVVTVVMYPSNNVPLISYDEQTCEAKANMEKISTAVEYASYGTLAASALPCKIVGLELFGVLQLAHINVGNMDNVNTMITPLMGMKGVHGFSMQLGKEDKNKTRLLQTAYTPNRVQSIGYESNFLRNCNVMLIVVAAVMLVSLTLYICTWLCQTCAPCLHSISKRIIKEVLLTLILFNCFNFAYSAGLHFNYAPKDDSLYTFGTVAAVLALVVPLLMAVALMCAEDEGFGEYKEKFKPGLVNRLYFVVTILYRTGIGLYISTTNEDAMSTLIVMALSIAFLLYNLVNLPYTKAYHNYRANVCHFTQFICLFVSMYYRSMMGGASSAAVAQMYTPAYIQMAAIALSLVVSVIVLAYEIYLFVVDCISKKEVVNEAERVSNKSSHYNKRRITEDNLMSFTKDKKTEEDLDDL